MLLPIHILVVDDNPDLLQGTAVLLRKAGYTVGTAATGGEALAYVHATPPHIVLLDRQLPDVDGMEVCRKIKEAQIAANICIVVMVSGFHTGLEAQLAGLETGADGYIARPVSNRELIVRVESFARIVRLTQSLAEKTEKIRVQDANLEQRVQERTASLALANQKLDEARRAAFSMTEDANLAGKRLAAANNELRREIAQREQAEASLRFSQFVMENMADSVLWIAEDSTVHYANTAACRMLGYTKAELLSLHIQDLTINRAVENFSAHWKELQRAGSMFFETFMRASGGNLIPVEVRTNFMSFGGKSYDCGFVRDITERRRAEDQARRWQRVFDASGFSLAHTDPATNTFIEVNNACARLLGYTPDELAGKPILTIYAPEAVPDLQAKLAGIDQAGHAAFESTFIRKDGTRVAVFVDVTSIHDSTGKPTSRVAYAMDISERKRAEQMIQRHIQLLSQAGNAARFGYYVADVATGCWESSPLLDEVFGIGPDFQRDLSDKGWGALVYPDDWEETSRSFAKTMAGEGDFRHDYRIIRQNDRQLRWVAGYGIPELGADGKPARVIGCIQDITDRVAAEANLRESEARYRLLAENSTDVVWLMDVTTQRFTYVSPSIERLRGYTPEEVLSQTLQEALTPESFREVETVLPQRLAAYEAGDDSAGNQNYVIWQTRRDGSAVPTEISTCFIADKHRKVTHIQGVSRDISERLQSEAKLRESEARYRLLAENASDVIWLLDLSTRRFVYTSPAVMKLRGFTPEEVQNQTLAEVLAPESLEMTEKLIRLRLAAFVAGDDSVRVNTQELDMLRKDGSTVPTEVVVTLLTDEHRRPTHLQGITRDITEHKRAQAALKESEERFRAYIEQAADAVMIHDLSGRFVDVNKIACERLGYTRAELLELGVPDLEVELAPFALESSWRDTKPGQRMVEHGRHRRKDGTTFPVEVAFSVFDLRGRRLFLCLVSDITERQQAQERAGLLRKLGFALAQSSDLNEMLRLCLDTAIRVSGMDSGGLYLEKEPVGDLELLCHSGLSEDFIAAVSRVQANRVAAAMPGGKKALFGNAKKNKSSFHTAEEQEGLHALAVVPIYHADRIVACLNVASHTVDEISAAGCDALETVASLIGGVIHRLRDKAELQAGAERLRSLLESMDDLVFVLSRDLVFQQYHQPSNARLLLPPSEFFGKNFDEIGFPEPGRSIIKSALLKTLETGETTTAEYHLDHVGRRMWFDMHVTPFKSQDGRTTGLTCVVRNVTEARRTAESLRESDLRLSMAVQGARMGVWDWDMTNGKTVWSGNTESLFGYAPGEFRGTQAEFESRIHPDDFAAMRQIGDQAMLERKSFQVEHRVVWPDGSVHWLSTHGQHFFDGDGKPIRMTGVVFDITERKKAEQELSDRASELQRRNQELDRFNRTAVGREIRMIELKQEVNELCRSANLPPRYGTDAAEMLAAARPASPKTFP